MATFRTFARAFSAGEITPEMWGRIDDAKFQTGLATCRNFEVLPHGPVRNRAGFAFVRATKDSGSKKARLIPFTFSTTQTMVLEFGAGYIRFHTQGATLLDSGSPYEVATPYAEADLFGLNYVQSADVLTIVHPGYAPRELRRLGATNWTLTTISFASSLAAPTSPSAVATAGTTPGTASTQDYVVTAVGADGLDESPPSAAATCSNNLFDTGAHNDLTWAASAGASRYNVYRKSSGLYGYIGQTTGLTFTDAGGGDVVTPDISRTPPISEAPFTGAGNYPAAISYFEQRRWFAGTVNAPQTIWGTKSGTESNMNYALPVRDDDRIKFRVQAREANTIRHLVPLQQLVALTSAAEWRVASVNSDALTPSSISVKPQSAIGANNVQPVVVNNNLLYPAARGGHVRELAYNWQASGYVTGDLSLRAPHLFDGLDIVDMAHVKAPHPVVWCVSSSGKLVGLTYVPEQNVGAWHQHDTYRGAFESVAAVAEGSEDVLYAIVRRTINGATVRYVERMASRKLPAVETVMEGADGSTTLATDVVQAEAFIVDAGLTYRGTPVTTITGLSHLEGCIVSTLGDGAVMPRQVVQGGSITLPQAISVAHIGLPITADLETLPVAIEVQGYGQGRPKNVSRVWLRVFESSGIFAGPRFDRLAEAKQRTTEPYGSAPELKTREISIDVPPSWGDAGGVCIRQKDPLPLTVLSLSLEVSIGG